MIVKKNYIIIILSILILSAALPWTYSTFFEPVNNISVNYSIVKNDFLIYEPIGSQRYYYNSSGEEMSRSEYQESLPLLLYKILDRDGKLPDSINHKKVSKLNIRKHNYFERFTYYNINAPKIQTGLMHESVNNSGVFAITNQYFHCKHSFQFINVYGKETDHTKSEAFTKALTDQGYKFPTRKFFYNDNLKKTYDYGIYLIDQLDHLFMLRMVDGEPKASIVRIPFKLHIDYIKCCAPPNKEIFAIIVGDNNELLLHLGARDYLQEINVTNFNRKEDVVQLFSNTEFKTIKLINKRKIDLFVLNNNYGIDRSYHYPDLAESYKTYDKFYDLLFPFSTTLNTRSNTLIKPVFRLTKNIGVILTHMILILIYFIIYRKRRGWKDYLILLMTGMYGFTCLLFIGDS